MPRIRKSLLIAAISASLLNACISPRVAAPTTFPSDLNAASPNVRVVLGELEEAVEAVPDRAGPYLTGVANGIRRNAPSAQLSPNLVEERDLIAQEGQRTLLVRIRMTNITAELRGNGRYMLLGLSWLILPVFFYPAAKHVGVEAHTVIESTIYDATGLSRGADGFVDISTIAPLSRAEFEFETIGERSMSASGHDEMLGLMADETARQYLMRLREQLTQVLAR